MLPAMKTSRARRSMRGRHFRKAYDLPPSPHAARLKLRAGLADYIAFVRGLLHVENALDAARLTFELAGILSLLGVA